MNRRQFFVITTSVFSAVAAVNAVEPIPSRKSFPNKECSPICTYCDWGSRLGLLDESENVLTKEKWLDDLLELVEKRKTI